MSRSRRAFAAWNACAHAFMHGPKVKASSSCKQHALRCENLEALSCLVVHDEPPVEVVRVHSGFCSRESLRWRCHWCSSSTLRLRIACSTLVLARTRRGSNREAHIRTENSVQNTRCSSKLSNRGRTANAGSSAFLFANCNIFAFE